MEDLELRFEKTVFALGKAGERYASAKALSWHMQELRKVILATEASKFDGSEALKERLARSSKAYRTHLDGTMEAIEKEMKHKCRYEKLKAQFEAYRSLGSLEKAKMQIT